MKCEDVERMLSLYLSDELKTVEKRSVQEHLNECLDCRESLALHRLSSRVLSGQGTVPAGLHAKTLQHLQPKQAPSWLTRILGDPNMRKFAAVSAAAAIIAVSFFGLAPQIAQASTAKETLSEMNLALAKASARGEIALNVESTTEGTVTVSGTMDGRPLPTTFPVETKVTRDGSDSVLIEITINFEVAVYESVSFGKDKNTLELVPNGALDKKLIVSLDPKTRLPLAVSSRVKTGSVWKETSRNVFKPRLSQAAAAAVAPTVAKAAIKMNLGQKAVVTIIAS